MSSSSVLDIISNITDPKQCTAEKISGMCDMSVHQLRRKYATDIKLHKQSLNNKPPTVAVTPTAPNESNQELLKILVTLSAKVDKLTKEVIKLRDKRSKDETSEGWYSTGYDMNGTMAGDREAYVELLFASGAKRKMTWGDYIDSGRRFIAFVNTNYEDAGDCSSDVYMSIRPCETPPHTASIRKIMKHLGIK